MPAGLAEEVQACFLGVGVGMGKERCPATLLRVIGKHKIGMT